MNFLNFLKEKRQSLIAILVIYLVLVVGAIYVFNNAVIRYQEVVEKENSLLLLTQVQSVLLALDENLQNVDVEKKIRLRTTLENFVDPSSKIRVLVLFDPKKKVVAASEEYFEDLFTKQAIPDEFFNAEQATTTKDSVDTERNIRQIEVIAPIIDQNKQLFGYLAGQVWDVPANWYLDNRHFIFSLLALLSAALLAIPLLVWHWFDNQSESDTTKGIVHSPQNKPQQSSENSESEEVDTVFSNLNKLYNEDEELNKSFQKSEEQINSMMRVLNQGLLILDLNMNIITHNEYLIDVLQIRSTSNANRRIYDLLQKNPRLLEMYRRAKQPLTHEVKQSFSLKLLNERTISTEVMVRPFYNEDEIYGIAFYIKNTDVLNELEGTLQRSMKYGVISQLASSIGHEIRNPLSSLAIHTEIVDNMVEKSVDDEKRLQKIQKSIGILNSEVERLQKLIDQFFNLAKAQEIVLTYENMNEVMRGILDLVQQQAFEKNVEIKIFFSKELPLVRVSKDQLKQVIINLILNGFDAMPDGGQLAIRTHFAEGKVFISIKDSGHGIPENVRDNIFDLYFTTKESGGGIGLAISRKIIEAHEGRLYFETKTGVGTIFHIELPVS